MTLIVVFTALAAPQLAGFVRGRTLDSEARRFLALTRMGASEAASRAEAMELWISPKDGRYGLQVFADYPGDGFTPRSYALHAGLQIEALPKKDDVLSILFTPDGLVDMQEAEGVCIANHFQQEDRLTIELDETGTEFVIDSGDEDDDEK